VEGEPLANGQPLSGAFFRRHCAYVLQEDRLWGSLSVRENLEVAAQFYMGGATAAARLEAVDRVVDMLGLGSAQHVKAGNVLIKGCSGGQRRRLSIGVELLKSPPIMFLDEPTSGLDSAAAAGIMRKLTELSREQGVAVATSVHQPSTSIFLAFDRICLLARGRVAYLGEASAAAGYFKALGKPCPQNYNPADFLLDQTNPDFGDEAAVNEVLDAWERGGSGKEHDIAASSAKEHSPVEVGSGADPAGFLTQVAVIARRTTLVYVRDPAAYIGRGVLYLQMSVVFGLIYLQLEEKQEQVQSFVFATCWGMAIPSYMACCSLPAMILDIATLRKEQKNGMYSAAAYTAATFLAQLPLVLTMTVLTSLPSYWLAGLNDDGGRFMSFMWINFSFLVWCESLCMLVGALVPNFVLAIAVVCSVLSTFFVFCGVFNNRDDVPWVMRWLAYISPHKYALEAGMYYVFAGKTFDDFGECVLDPAAHGGLCWGATGEQVLETVPGLEPDPDLALNNSFLWAFAAALRLAQWRVLSKATL